MVVPTVYCPVDEVSGQAVLGALRLYVVQSSAVVQIINGTHVQISSCTVNVSLFLQYSILVVVKFYR